MFEGQLREVDAAIQAEAKRRRPRGWAERVRHNMAKAWGDPDAPWFRPDGRGAGYDQLKLLGMLLYVRAQKEPFANAYYSVEDYFKAYRLLTDPQAKLGEMRAQAMSGILAGAPVAMARWGPALRHLGPSVTARTRGFVRQTMMGRRPALGASNGTTGPLSRDLRTHLRNTILGIRTALGDIGGSGAEIGFPKARPAVVVASPAKPAAPARPTTPAARHNDPDNLGKGAPKRSPKATPSKPRPTRKPTNARETPENDRRTTSPKDAGHSGLFDDVPTNPHGHPFDDLDTDVDGKPYIEELPLEDYDTEQAPPREPDTGGDVTVEDIPLEEIETSGSRSTFGDLLLDSLPNPDVRRVELTMIGGRWCEVDSDGVRPANGGTYKFVVQNGRIYAGADGYGTHVTAAQGGRVSWAGELHIDEDTGQVTAWDDVSGHYRPASSFKDAAIRAGLPEGKWRQETDRDPKPQLPVEQPRTRSRTGGPAKIPPGLPRLAELEQLTRSRPTPGSSPRAPEPDEAGKGTRRKLPKGARPHQKPTSAKETAEDDRQTVSDKRRGTVVQYPPPMPVSGRELDAAGTPAGAYIIPVRVHEWPYLNPPDLIMVGPGRPLDVGRLDPSKRYLWVLRSDGRFVVASEGQETMYPDRGRLEDPHPQRGQTRATHRDLVAPPEGTSDYPAARQGGELWPLLDARGNPTGVWTMNNASAYVYSRDDHEHLTGDHLDAALRLLERYGTDTSKILTINSHGADADVTKPF